MVAIEVKAGTSYEWKWILKLKRIDIYKLTYEEQDLARMKSESLWFEHDNYCGNLALT